MFQSMVSELVKQWFDEYARLAYWVARRWSERLLNAKARDYSSSDLEELTQDAVCRGFDRFAKRCQREICGAPVRAKQCRQKTVSGFSPHRRHVGGLNQCVNMVWHPAVS